MINLHQLILYARIQSEYAANPNRTEGMTFTNNIYGYDYRANPTDKYTYEGNESQYTPPPIERVKRQAIAGSDIYSGTAYENQRLLFDRNDESLSNYQLYDPQNTASSVLTLQDSTNNDNNNTLMYYPYRTNITAGSVSQINSTNQILLRDQVNADCTTTDPEWCSTYVNITYQGLTTYDNMNKNNACTTLKNSLKESFSSCCVAVKGIGC
uniref:ShKT domain-containing protein n=1 Tax=Parastrongyloides trichosuri TaxID=131310 RepID=A0A0N4ZKA3_PARTI